MKIYNWWEFLAENMQMAKKILKDNKKPENDGSFLAIKNIVGNNTSYLGLFTKYYYEQNVSIDDLQELINFLRDYASRLPQNVLKYDSYEKLTDDINDVKRDTNVKLIYNKLTSTQKEFTDIESQEFKNLAYEISKIPNKGFFAKISKVKSFKQLISLMSDYIEKNKMGASYDTLIEMINKTKNVDVVYDNNEIVIVCVNTYQACKSLGSTNWCIVNSESNWNSYTDVRNQYIVWNFEYNIGQPYYMIGITVDFKDGIYAAHDYNDKSVRDNLPSFLKSLKKYLKGPSEKELSDKQVEREERRIREREEEIRRERERIQNMIRKNQVLKETGRWNDTRFHVIKEFLIDGGLFDENTDDDSMIFYRPESFYNADEFEYNDDCFIICSEEEANILTLNIIRDWEIEFFPISILLECMDVDRYADSYVDEELIRDDWEYLDIESDENGEMDENSFEEYVESQKDDIKNDVLSHIEELYGNDDKEVRSVISNFLYHDWIYQVAKIFIDRGYRGEVISSFDSVENELVYDGVTYYIYRI